MATASARIQAVKAAAAAAAATTAEPEKDGDDMSLASLDQRLAALAAPTAPLPTLPTLSAPKWDSDVVLSFGIPSPSLSPLQQLSQLIDSWGTAVWYAKKEPGTNLMAFPFGSFTPPLIPCGDEDWVARKGEFIRQMTRMKELCTAAMQTTTLAAASASAPSAASPSKQTSFARDRIRDYCQCRSNKPCSTRHCKCVFRGAGSCTDACSCKGMCDNNHPPAPHLVGVELNPSVYL